MTECGERRGHAWGAATPTVARELLRDARYELLRRERDDGGYVRGGRTYGFVAQCERCYVYDVEVRVDGAWHHMTVWLDARRSGAPARARVRHATISSRPRAINS